MLIFPAANAQRRLHIVAQKDYDYTVSATLDSLGVQKKPDFERVVLQIRFYILNNATGIHKVFLIDSLKSGEWQGQSIEYYAYNDEHYDYRNIIRRALELGRNWTSTFQQIKKQGYINLPTQKEVLKRIAEESKGKPPSTTVVADGTSYFLAFITKKKSRRINFSNPESYVNIFKAEGYEKTVFDDYLKLLHILAGSLDFQTHLTKPN